jgi:glycogen(starch) synthase
MRIVATVTFNPNQLRAHLEPIADLDEVDEIVLVADQVPPPMPKLRAIVPSTLLTRVVGRAVAKLIVTCRVARRLRPEWVIGFNLVPHGINAIAAAHAARARSAYVMIGGPVEWEGGGWRSDNKVLGRLGRSAPLLERALLAVVRRASIVVTMGSRGREALMRRGLDAGRVTAIPASIDEGRFRPRPRPADARWDVVAVAELIPTKRLTDLLDAVALLVSEHPRLRAAIAGAGPLRDDLESRARELGIHDHVELLGFRGDIADVYAQARVFVLPSAYEGLSISLLEAMASGLAVVVSDVGEARDVVDHGANGLLYEPGDVNALARLVAELLEDPVRCGQLGEAAARDAAGHAGRPVVSAAYRAVLTADPS